MENNSISMLSKCEDCKADLSLNKNSVEYAKEFMSGEDKMYLTYFDCHICGKRHFVQIDSDESLAVLTKANLMIRELMKLRHDGKKISKKKKAQYEKTKTHLSEIRINLMKEYQDKEITSDGTDYSILRFSICN